MPPPPENGGLMDRGEFDQLIVDATRALAIGNYQDALAQLDRAEGRFPTLWSTDAKARTMHDDVRCRVLLDKARESLHSGDLDSAEGKLKEGLEIRPKDEELGKLRDEVLQRRATKLVGAAERASKKPNLDEASRLLQEAIGLRPGDAAVQARLDQLEVERLRHRAAMDFAAEDFPSAVDAIVKSYGILEKPSNSSAPWCAAARSAVDQLAEPLIGDLYD